MMTTSIVIATDGRADALAQTLQCLQFLEGPEFEVIVVKGPTKDGTDDVVAAWGDKIKVASNTERNLSQSRNIGILQASGDLVAFIDDDGNPEPEWLSQVVEAFDDPNIAGVGGLVLDHTGWKPQYRYASANRYGDADWARTTPADHFNFPYSFNFPYLQGTNSVFRRSHLLEIGAFDEEYEFYLDETDVCCRLIDKGWTIRQLPNAIVHHKFLPSQIRDGNRITKARYAILKNKLYFSIINNHGHYSTQDAVVQMEKFAEANSADLWQHFQAGRIERSDIDQFEIDRRNAWDVGLRRGLSGVRRTLKPEDITSPPQFRKFPKLLPEKGRKHYVFASAEYPPERTGGVGRYIHQLALETAALGHHVRVVAHTDEHPRTDFEDGVWVDRIPSGSVADRPKDLSDIPDRIWDRAATVRDRLAFIESSRPISAVYAPIWDCEGIAILRQGIYPLATGLQTTLQFWLDSQPHLKADVSFMKAHGTPMLRVEQELIEKTQSLHSISTPLLENIIKTYGIEPLDTRARIIHLGLEDWTKLPFMAPKPVPAEALRLLFVGRLETRKGIDILLEIAPKLLERYPHVHLDLVGNDQINGPDNITFRKAFEARGHPESVTSRIHFHGEVNEEMLRGFYAECDILVGPSRYESFGLMLVEGMMFSKPVIGCAAGGMLEVIEDGVSGLLATPGDAVSLMTALERLVTDNDLRTELGNNGRIRYEQNFTATVMARKMEAFLLEMEEDWRVARAQG